ncbi:MAG: hypothetical protein JNL05_09975 [Flavobacteriales bacterium]|nr:hypothetical protein [Flavobacteriales bacterium]
MKTVRQLVIALAWGFPLALLGQVPQGFSYQAVARSTSGDPLAAQAVGVQFVLHQGNAFGAVVYAESHATTTNAHGLFSLTVGGGSASAGTFSAIDWSNGPYFLEVGLDVGNNGSYLAMGTQQLMSVPYALYAGRSNVPDGTEVGQVLHWTGTQWAADSGLYVHAKRFGIGVAQPDAPLAIRSSGNGYKLFSVTGQPTPVGAAHFTASLPQTPQASGFDLAEDTTGGSASRLFIQQSTGNVGLGTTHPEGALTLRTSNPRKVGFQNGDIPNQDDFWNLIDSRGYGVGQGLSDSITLHVVVQDSTGHLGVGTDDPPAPLTVASREKLKTYFQTGDIPTQDDFAFTSDSTGFGVGQGMPGALVSRLFIQASTGNVGLGTIAPAEKLHLNGAIVVGDTYNATPNDGTIRYTGTDFEGYTAGNWRSLGGPWEKVDNTAGVSLLSPSNARVGINEPLPQTTLHVQRPASDPDNGTQLDAGSGIATFGDLIDSSINLSDDGIQVRVPAPPGSTHPLAPGALHLQRLGGDVLFHGDAATASEKVIIRSGGNVGIGELVPDASLHVRGREQCDDGNMVVRVDNPTTTTSTASSATRVGLQVTNTGVWSSNGEAKNIGLLVSSSGQANANANLAAVLNGNVVVGGLSTGPSVGAGGTNVLAIQNGAPPASPPAGTVQLYVTTASDGTSVLNIMDGNGGVMQLHVQNPLSAPDNNTVNPLYDAGTAAVITNMRTRINELESRLQALGLLAP